MNGQRFSDRVVMVAGGAQGLGRATALRFAQEGADVVLVDVADALDEARDEVSGVARTGSPALALRCDVTDPDACRRAVAEVVGERGRLDVLAFVAGVLQQAAPVQDLEPAEWDRVHGVNLRGPYCMARAVAPQMIEQRYGRIVTVASWWGRSGHAYFSAYCSSKAGLIVFTQALADELAEHGVTANTICPGNINTPMHHKALHDEADKRQISYEEMRAIEWRKIPMGRPGEPVEIGEAILFLASDEAGYITGASLDVNGGVLFH